MQALAVALMPRAPALQRVVVLTPRALVPLVVVLMSREPARLLAFVPRALGLQPGPSYVCALLAAAPVLGSTVWLRDRPLVPPSSSPAP